MDRESLLPIIDSKRIARKKYASGKACTFDGNKVTEEVKQVRKLRKKQLTMPLTHVLINANETYDITKEYEFINLIGVGAYSQVKLAKCLSTGQQVAIKICKGENSREMLGKEKDILKGLSSDFFPKVIDFKINKLFEKGNGETIYLILEYIEGLTLDEYLSSNPDLDTETASGFLIQLCQMIKILHGLKICHRDIKPQNIIVTADKKLKLIDFNISKVWKDKPSDEKFMATFITQVGTPFYAAPEVYAKKGYSESIDIWGLGIIGFMLFGGTAEINIKKLVLEGDELALPYVDYVQTSPIIPDLMKIFIMQCLDVEPVKRCSVNDEVFMHMLDQF